MLILDQVIVGLTWGELKQEIIVLVSVVYQLSLDANILRMLYSGRVWEQF